MGYCILALFLSDNLWSLVCYYLKEASLFVYWICLMTSSICFLFQERGEPVPPEDSLDVARRVKEMYCYTCADIVKVLYLYLVIT